MKTRSLRFHRIQPIRNNRRSEYRKKGDWMIRRTAVAPAVMVWLAISLSAQTPADQTPPSAPAVPAVCPAPAPKASEAPAPKKQDLSSWWQKNAMKLKPLPAQWLFHGDGTLSYVNASGNMSGSTLDVAADGEVRKDRFTDHLLAELSRKDIVYGLGLGSVDYAERTLREQLDFDPVESITFFATIEDYKNTLMYMDKRLLVYGGMGGRVFKNEKSEVDLNGGMGYADFTFDRARLLSADPSQAGLNTSPSSGGAIGTQTWRWAVSPRFSFSEDASYMKYFDSYLGYRWTINLNGNIPINKLFSFNVRYRIKEETATIIKALGVFPQDRTFLMGIRVSI
jgi:hypothetical protein